MASRIIPPLENINPDSKVGNKLHNKSEDEMKTEDKDDVNASAERIANTQNMQEKLNKDVLKTGKETDDSLSEIDASPGNKVSSSSSDLAENRTENFPFRCEICNFRTSEKSDLDRHMLTHVGEKPFACTKCDYKTAFRDYLRNHQKIHIGENS